MKWSNLLCPALKWYPSKTCQKLLFAIMLFLLILEKKRINAAHKGINWPATQFQFVLGHKQRPETHAVT